MSTRISFDSWMRGRAARREAVVAAVGGPLFRESGPDDEVLKQWDGRRNLEYPSLDTLKSYESASAGDLGLGSDASLPKGF